jgi:hypothetical protein
MRKTCDHCGEELLGAVNRCWRCGQETDRTHVAAPSDATASSTKAETPDSLIRQPLAVTSTGRQPHLRNPHGPRAAAPGAAASGAGHWDGSAISAWVGFVLSLLALLALNYLSLVSLGLALMAFAMTLWGVWGRFRGLAMLALLLTWGAFSVAGYQLASDWYEWRYGVRPFSDPLDDEFSRDPAGVGE